MVAVKRKPPSSNVKFSDPRLLGSRWRSIILRPRW
jgi:hypothetical protein